MGTSGWNYPPECSVCGAETKQGDGRAKGKCSHCYHREFKHKYYGVEENKQNQAAKAANYYQRHKADRIRRSNVNKQQRRARVIATLGGMCACCGESEPKFLTIDHIGGGGRAHREKRRSNHLIVTDIDREGCPRDKYRILCWNCNAVIGLWGACPHSASSVGTSPTT